MGGFSLYCTLALYPQACASGSGAGAGFGFGFGSGSGLVLVLVLKYRGGRALSVVRFDALPSGVWLWFLCRFSVLV